LSYDSISYFLNDFKSLCGYVANISLNTIVHSQVLTRMIFSLLRNVCSVSDVYFFNKSKHQLCFRMCAVGDLIGAF